MYKIGQGVYPSDCESAGVEVGADRTLNCLVDSEGFCISVSWDDISYTATNESLTPVEGSCTLPTFIPDTQIGQMVASDGASDDNYGHSVSISGDTAIIGAPFDDDQGDFSGSAYIFTRSGGSWSQQAKLTKNGAATYDHFGSSIDLSEETAIIGSNGNSAAYIFTRSGSTWTEQDELISSDGASNNFGYSVALSGNTAVIGAHLDGANGPGAAYVFTRSGSEWSQQSKLELGTPYPFTDDYFGINSDMSGDTAIIIANGPYGSSANIFQPSL